MAIRYYAATIKGISANIHHGFDGVDAAVDAALGQEDIDASEDAEAAVEAIRTAFALQSGDVTVMFDDEVITRRDDLKRVLEQVLRTLEGSDALSS